ncbi:MAG TPA: immunoglobulin-like domain-containing protein [Marinagarivorans sp.]
MTASISSMVASSSSVQADVAPPVITLVGGENLVLAIGEAYTDPGVNATDDIDGDLSADITVGGDAVDTTVEGQYSVTYDVSDAAGNSAVQVVRTVIVDGTAPDLALLGDDPTLLSVGDTFEDPGATATDAVDGDVSASVVVAGDTVDTATEGRYTLTYNVADQAGNAATEVTRTVLVDDTPPVLTLLGDNPLELSVGGDYTDPGATAQDAVDGDISATIVVAGDTVDTATAGSYSVTYNVVDASGNAASQVARTVTVSNDPPVINNFAISPSPAFVSSPASFNWDVSDINGDTLTCTLDIDSDGTVDYTLEDCSTSTTQAHTYATAGSYTALLTVDDGIAEPVTQALELTVIAPLAASVTASGPAVAGERVFYTLTVGNTTLQPIDDVVVSLVVPEALSFSAANDTAPNSSSCGNGLCTSGETASWQRDTLGAGESWTIDVNALVAAELLDGANIDLPVTFNATDISSFIITKNLEVFNAPSADLVLSASTDPVVPSEIFSYYLDFGNTSAGPLVDAELRALIPAGLTVIDISDGGTEMTPGEVIWDEGSVAVGASLRREITVAADGVAAGQVLVASAQLIHDGELAVDNVSEHVITVVENPLSLQVKIDTSANPVVSEERVLYTVTVSNTSALPVESVTVQLRLPAELSYTAAKDSAPDSSSCGNGACTPSEEASWTIDSLPAGESRTIQVNALVGSVLSGNLISMPFRVTATDLGDTIGLLKTLAVYNTPSADLAVSASTDPVVSNETFTYRLDFGNTGAVPLTTTQLRAYLPAGVTVVEISDGGMETAAGEVVWDEGSVPVGASLHREITVTADSVVAGQILTATAQLTHEQGRSIDKISEHSLTVVEAPLPLQVSISTSANPVVTEERVLYTITLGNTSSLPVRDVTVLMRLPAELSFTAAGDSSPNSSACGNGVCTPTEEASWTIDRLPAGESRTIQVNAQVASVLSGNLISVPFRVTATDVGDTISLVNTLAVYNTPSADLAISASVDPVVPNETFTYLLDFGNTGAAPLTSTELRAFLPAGVTAVAISDGGMETADGEIVWSEGGVPVGASLYREVTVTADDVIAGQILTATAQLVHEGGRVIDKSSEYTLTVVEAPLPLQFDISASANPVVSGERVLYTLTVSNTSLLPVNDVTVLLRLPAELSYTAAGDSAPNSSSCGNGACTATEEASWSFERIAAGESVTIHINASVGEVLSGNLISMPFLVTAEDLGDTVSVLKTLAVFNTPAANFSVSASTDPVVPNQTFSYYLDFGNTSGTALSNVVLRASLPDGVSLSAISDAGVETASGELEWTLATLASGAAVRREVEVVADSAIAGDSLKLAAALSHDMGLEVDLKSEFVVSTTESTGIAALMNFEVEATPNPVASGGVLAYALTITNGYGLPVEGVNVQLRLPPELSFTAASGAVPPSSSCGNGVCTANEEANWDLGTMAAGESQTIAINAQVAAALADGLLITAPFRLTATGMLDVISLQHTAVIEN